HALLETRDARLQVGQLVRIEAVARRLAEPFLDVARLVLQPVCRMVANDIRAVHEPDAVLQNVDPLLQLLHLAEAVVAVAVVALTTVAIELAVGLRLRIILGRGRARERESRTSGSKSNYKLTHHGSPLSTWVDALESAPIRLRRV